MQVPAPPAITLEPGFQTAQAVSRQAMIDSLRAALGVGNQLNITVAERGGGERGVLIEGQFFRADVPEGARAGSQLSVTVADSKDAVVLKILNHAAGFSAARPYKPTLPWESFLRQVLPPDAIEILKKIKILNSVETGELAAGSEVKTLVDKLVSTKLVLNDPALKSPEMAKTVLETISKLSPKNRISTGLKQSGQQPGNTLSLTNEFFSSLFAAQEHLNLMNPAAAAFNEKTVLFVPVFLNGLLTRWELNAKVSPPRDEKNKDSPEAPKLFSITVSLPSLGAVKVSLSFTKDDLYLKLTCEKEDAAEFLNTLLPKLNDNLRRYGFKNTACRVEAGKAENGKPNWYQALPLLDSKA